MEKDMKQSKAILGIMLVMILFLNSVIVSGQQLDMPDSIFAFPPLDTEKLEKYEKPDPSDISNGVERYVIYVDDGYTLADCTVMGEVKSGRPIDQSWITITWRYKNMELSGRYKYLDGKHIIQGCLQLWRSSGEGKDKIYGTFSICNTKNGGFKLKKSRQLSVNIIEYIGYKPFMEKGWGGQSTPCDIYLMALNDKEDELYIKQPKVSCIYSVIPSQKNDLILSFNVILSKLSENGVIYAGRPLPSLDVFTSKLSNAKEKKYGGRVLGPGGQFCGNIKLELDEMERLHIEFLDGVQTRVWTDNKGNVSSIDTIVIAKDKNGGWYKCDNSKTLFMPNDVTELPESGDLWNDAYWCRYLADRVSLNFTNGDTYEGAFDYKFDEIIPTKGIYEYHNGDKFIGDCSKTYGGIYIDGTTIFNDGTKEQGNWLAQYQVPDNVLNKWDSDKRMGNIRMCPTEVRLAAINENEVMRAKMQELTKKYGKKYADNIMNGVIEVGMTKEMCELVVNKIIGTDFYRISTWTNFAGDEMETWEFDYEYGIEKAKRRQLKEDIENNDKYAFFTYQFMDAFGNFTSGLASNMIEYKYLKFRNSVLIELKDSSLYDDMNNAQQNVKDALNSLY